MIYSTHVGQTGRLPPLEMRSGFQVSFDPLVNRSFTGSRVAVGGGHHRLKKSLDPDATLGCRILLVDYIAEKAANMVTATQRNQWKVGDLAKETGLSIRTLHYYDQIGLLSPSFRTRSGHRLYVAQDIKRLQQIASLRQLGFSLDEIERCLKSPGMSARRVIEFHISRLKEQIELQSKLRGRLESIAARLDSRREISVDDLIQTIEVTNMVGKYYTPEQLETLRQRADTIGQDRIRESEKEWADLIRQVGEEMEKGTDPSSERVRNLAEKWMALIQEFTGGDPGIAKSLGTMWQQEENIHGQDTKRMREMMAYISKARQ